MLRRLEERAQSARSSRGKLPNFTVGDFGLVARMPKTWPHATLMSHGTGPDSAGREHLYGVQHLVNVETRDTYALRAFVRTSMSTLRLPNAWIISYNICNTEQSTISTAWPSHELGTQLVPAKSLYLRVLVHISRDSSFS